MSESPLAGNKMSWVRLGGSLGIAGACIGLAIFIAGCFGLTAAFALSVIPLAMGVVSTALVVLGATLQKDVHVEDSAPMAAVFPALMALIGGFLLFAVWMKWAILPGGATAATGL